MDDAHGDAGLAAFRAEARAWIESNLPPSLRGRPSLGLTEGPAPGGEVATWRARLADRGWGAPTWPKAYGGGGLSEPEAAVLRQEMARVGACNPMVGIGLTMVGPTLLDYGTEAQKQRHVPPIARGEVVWCLGYSEPNAGSDLASLQTRCEDKGDHWEVTGQKVWTSGAHHAQWCGALVRTDPRAPKHEGISFVLLRMDQPGVEARPIALIAGESPFCEVFFTGARVEKDDMLGELNRGWTVGKRLLQHERSSQTGEGVLNPAKPPPLEAIAREHVGLDAEGRLADPDLRARLTAHLMQAAAHELTLARVAADAKQGGVSNAASMLKNSATQAAQTRAELLVEILGMPGLGWAGEPFAESDLAAVRTWLYSKSMSIYGGTFEVQNDIVAKRILGLPDAARSAGA
jgi:alkylation response protein AidB-like acyl-CoA dehydrogenase